MKRDLRPLWIITLLIIASPIIYFLLRIGNRAFVDSSMGDLFATILGILIGVPVALEINRRQEESRRDIEEKARESEEKELVASLIRRMEEELQKNHQDLSRMKASLDKSKLSRSDHWAWMVAISDGFAFSAYQDLLDTGLWSRIPVANYDSIKAAYSLLEGLVHRTREAQAAHTFHYGYKADRESADAELQYVRDLAREAERRLKEGLEKMERINIK